MTSPTGPCLRNIHEPRRSQWILGLAGFTFFASVAIGIASDDLAGGLVLPLFLAAFVVGPFYSLRVAGLFIAQREACVESEGLRYGHRHLVPWSAVTDIVVQPRRGRAFLKAPTWRAQGWLANMVARQGLPLSDFDRDWYQDSAFVSALRQHLPQIDLDGALDRLARRR
jgi:hypothetical protein